ncbi:transposase [Streptosporangium roseum]|uniref:transposase n=1 Tax=Streptosporangium roseum TaxID=2001 RepID=UPI0001A3E1E5
MPPQILATAVLLQTLDGVSDVEAVQELRCDLRWKAACGLGLHDTAFDPSLLTYFRRRLARSTRPAGSSMRSARSSPKPACCAAATGGHWTRPCWTTR